VTRYLRPDGEISANMLYVLRAAEKAGLNRPEAIIGGASRAAPRFPNLETNASTIAHL